MKWKGHVIGMVNEQVIQNFTEKKGPLTKPMHIWKDNIKICLKMGMKV